ncbi:MAG TPA: HAMP domain-containing sensor histidine kinase [Jatrophihabitantaceae bacterium]
MKRPRLTARGRLTLVYGGLFTLGGAVLVTVTYLLVAHNLPAANATGGSKVNAAFVAQCDKAKREGDTQLAQKCAAAFQAGVNAGATVQRDTTLNHLLMYSLIALAGVSAVAALAGWLVAGRILRPVHQLTAAARAATEHNLSQRLALRGPRDELRELADTFDDMLARLDAAFASQNRFISNASHELRTPLTVMRTTVDVVLSKPAPTREELIAMGVDVRRAVDHAEALIDTLLTLARNERGLTTHQSVDLAMLAEDALDTITVDGLHVTAALQPAVVSGDPLLLERLVANLVDNAARHNVPDGSVSVGTAAHNGSAELRVTNTGPVVPADRVDALFEPFTRLDERTGDGVGLGLALVASISRIHHATIDAAPRVGGGLVVTVRIPR